MMNKEEFEQTELKLSSQQRLVLLHFLKGKSDPKIAELIGTEQDNVRKHIVNICHTFGFKNETGERLSFRDDLIELFCKYKKELVSNELCGRSNPDEEPEFPDGQVPLDSPFYVERLPIEPRCYEEILQSGSLIRIKAPKLTGKTSLMTRILAQAGKHQYRVVELNLLEADVSVITNLDTLLRWFCLRIGKQLELENQLDYYWDTKLLSSNSNCSVYFEEYLLPQINCPLALGLDEVDRIFSYPEIASDFFGLLRLWHEKAKRLNIWKQFRLIVVHSTEVYIPLNIDQSPFNVGLPVELPEFTSEQVQDLQRRYRLAWNNDQVGQLMDMVGGHPYLVRLAMYHVKRHGLKLEQLLSTAPTEEGIYKDHLRRLLGNLQKNSVLLEVFKKVVTASVPVRLEQMQVYKLLSMGLVKLRDDKVIPSCNLYRQYFSK